MTLKIKKASWLIPIFISAILLVAFLIITNNTFPSIHFQDDHELISIYSQLKESNFNIFEVFYSRMNTEIHSTHRFRPFYYFHRIVEVAAFQNNFYNLALYNLALIVITSWAFYSIGKGLGFNSFVSILFSTVVLVGGQMEILWMLGPAETIATLTYSLSLVCLLKSVYNGISVRFSIGYVTLMILSAFSKESFILLIPATIILQISLYMRKNSKNFYQSCVDNRYTILPLFLFFFVTLVIVKFYVGTAGIGYAGVENKTTILSYYRTFDSLFSSNNVFISLLIAEIAVISAVTVSVIKKTDYTSIARCYSAIFWLIAYASLLIIPQIILYTKSGLSGRYLLPTSIGIGLCLLAPFSYAASLFSTKAHHSIYTILAAVSTAVYLYPNFAMAKNSAVEYANQGLQSNGIIESIKANVASSRERYVLVVIDPTLTPTSETCASMEIFVNKFLNFENPVVYLFLEEDPLRKKEFSVFESNLYRSLKFWAGSKTIDKVIDRSKITSVIIFPGLEDNFLKHAEDWFDIAKYKRMTGKRFVHYYE
jgi:hypothetical protein